MAGYHKLKSLTEATLNQVDMIVAQSQGDAERFASIGMPENKIKHSGNIKFDMEIPGSVIESAEGLRGILGRDRAVWIAASTHEGEDQQVLDAYQRVREKIPDTLLMLVPRHPERFTSVVALCEKAGLNVVRRTEEKNCDKNTHVFVGDTLGELLQFYAAADVAFVGGSLVPTGGHNILEPAALNKPVVTGPYMFNFSEIAETMRDAGAIRQVENIDQLANTVIELLTNADERQRMGTRGYEHVENNRGSLKRLLDKVIPYIPG